MDHARNFYIQKNIMGYIGNIDDNPTIIFKSGDAYGRVEQGQEDPKDNGRTIVLQDPEFITRISDIDHKFSILKGNEVLYESPTAFHIANNSDREILMHAIKNKTKIRQSDQAIFNQAMADYFEPYNPDDHPSNHIRNAAWLFAYISCESIASVAQWDPTNNPLHIAS